MAVLLEYYIRFSCAVLLIVLFLPLTEQVHYSPSVDFVFAKYLLSYKNGITAVGSLTLQRLLPLLVSDISRLFQPSIIIDFLNG